MDWRVLYYLANELDSACMQFAAETFIVIVAVDWVTKIAQGLKSTFLTIHKSSLVWICPTESSNS